MIRVLDIAFPLTPIAWIVGCYNECRRYGGASDRFDHYRKHSRCMDYRRGLQVSLDPCPDCRETKP